ncbi:MAG: ribose-phosphate diphosphokinase [Halobacteriaceae archaeon]
MILSGRDSQSFARALAGATGTDLAVVETTGFADGEFVVRVPASLSGRAVVVAATVDDRAHLECLQLQDAAREAGASEVVTVLPYMGYARQDEAFRDGQPVSARAVARALSTGTDRVVLVNPHEPGVTEHFTVPAERVDAAPRLARGLPGDLDDPVFVGPDASAAGLAETVRDAHGTGEADHLEKHRDRETGAVTVEAAGCSVAGRDVVVVDDMVATGGTVSEAVSALADPGRVFVATVHPLLAENARSKLAAAGVERVLGTDTLERPESAVSAAPSVAGVL